MVRPKDKTCDYPFCKICNSNKHVRKKGFWVTRIDSRDEGRRKVQRFHCSKCDYHFMREKVRKLPDFMGSLDEKYKDV